MDIKEVLQQLKDRLIEIEDIKEEIALEIKAEETLIIEKDAVTNKHRGELNKINMQVYNLNNEEGEIQAVINKLTTFLPEEVEEESEEPVVPDEEPVEDAEGDLEEPGEVLPEDEGEDSPEEELPLEEPVIDPDEELEDNE